MRWGRGWNIFWPCLIKLYLIIYVNKIYMSDSFWRVNRQQCPQTLRWDLNKALWRCHCKDKELSFKLLSPTCPPESKRCLPFNWHATARLLLNLFLINKLQQRLHFPFSLFLLWFTVISIRVTFCSRWRLTFRKSLSLIIRFPGDGWEVKSPVRKFWEPSSSPANNGRYWPQGVYAVATWNFTVCQQQHRHGSQKAGVVVLAWSVSSCMAASQPHASVCLIVWALCPQNTI